MCDRTQHYHWSQLNPGSRMCFVYEEGYSCFQQNTTYHRYTDLLLAIDQNATIENPVLFDQEAY